MQEMKPQEIIKLLDECEQQIVTCERPTRWNTIKLMELVRQLWNGRDSWISVKDELPEERMIVDGVVDRWDNRVREDVWRVRDEFLTNKPYGVEVVEVTHWKCQTPLPPTPEGE